MQGQKLTFIHVEWNATAMSVDDIWTGETFSLYFCPIANHGG
jgi:hypothetical protein